MLKPKKFILHSYLYYSVKFPVLKPIYLISKKGLLSKTGGLFRSYWLLNRYLFMKERFILMKPKGVILSPYLHYLVLFPVSWPIILIRKRGLFSKTGNLFISYWLLIRYLFMKERFILMKPKTFILPSYLHYQVLFPVSKPLSLKRKRGLISKTGIFCPLPAIGS